MKHNVLSYSSTNKSASSSLASGTVSSCQSFAEKLAGYQVEDKVIRGTYGSYDVGSCGCRRARARLYNVQKRDSIFVAKFFMLKPSGSPEKEKYKQFLTYSSELYALKILTSCGVDRIARLIDHGETSIGSIPFVIIEKLGRSLECCTKASNFLRFTDRSGMITVYELISCLEAIHRYKIVSCDIKLDNFCLVNNPRKSGVFVKMIDFGISKVYGPHCMVELDRNDINYPLFCGTLDYAPRAAHYKKDQCPYDDLESMIYSILPLFGSKLPWIQTRTGDMLSSKWRFWDAEGVSYRSFLADLFKIVRSFSRSKPIPYTELKQFVLDQYDNLEAPIEANYPMVRKGDGKDYLIPTVL